MMMSDKQLINVKLVELDVMITNRSTGGQREVSQITYTTGTNSNPMTKAVGSNILAKNETLRAQLEDLAAGPLPTLAVMETVRNQTATGTFTNLVSIRPATEVDIEGMETTTTSAPVARTAFKPKATTSHTSGGSSSTNSKEESIRVAVALKAAVEFAAIENTGVTPSPETVIEIAKVFDTYLKGE